MPVTDVTLCNAFVDSVDAEKIDEGVYDYHRKSMVGINKYDLDRVAVVVVIVWSRELFFL